MKYIERIIMLLLIIAVGVLAYGQSAPDSEPHSAQKTRGDFKEVEPVETSGLIIGPGRFELEMTPTTQGQRAVLIRFDSATGEYAVLDTELGAWVAVELPLIKPQGRYDNDAHIRLISDMVFE